MRTFAGPFAAALILTGCSTAVIETRMGAPHERLAGSRTLVVADLAAPARGAAENAVAQRVPGAVAAHSLPGSPTAQAVEKLSAADWDTVVLVTVADERVQNTPDVAYPANEDRSTSARGLPGHTVAWLYLDVSVRRVPDRLELYGVKVRSDREVPATSTAAQDREAASAQVAAAADLAARRMMKAGLFD
jgi:hypothetical protein